MNYLRSLVTPQLRVQRATVTDGTLSFRTMLPANSVYCVIIRPTRLQ